MEKERQFGSTGLSINTLPKTKLGRFVVTSSVLFVLMAGCKDGEKSSEEVDTTSPPVVGLNVDTVVDQVDEELKQSRQTAEQKENVENLLLKLNQVFEATRWTEGEPNVLSLCDEFKTNGDLMLTYHQQQEIDAVLNKIIKAFSECEITSSNYESAEKFSDHWSGTYEEFKSMRQPRLSDAKAAKKYLEKILPQLESNLGYFIPLDAAIFEYQGLPTLYGSTKNKEVIYLWMLEQNVEVEAALSALQEKKGSMNFDREVESLLVRKPELRDNLRLWQLFSFSEYDDSIEVIEEKREEREKQYLLAESFDNKNWTKEPYSGGLSVLDLSLEYYEETNNPKYLKDLEAVILELKNGIKYETHNFWSLVIIKARLKYLLKNGDLPDPNLQKLLELAKN